METLGIEATRRRLPELVEAAHAGKPTLITRHGRPLAALVPAAMAQQRVRNPAALLALKGSGRGLWGSEPQRSIATLRDEWGA